MPFCFCHPAKAQFALKVTSRSIRGREHTSFIFAARIESCRAIPGIVVFTPFIPEPSTHNRPSFLTLVRWADRRPVEGADRYACPALIGAFSPRWWARHFCLARLRHSSTDCGPADRAAVLKVGHDICRRLHSARSRRPEKADRAGGRHAAPRDCSCRSSAAC